MMRGDVKTGSGSVGIPHSRALITRRAEFHGLARG
jgi:hypothetical protein